MRRPIGDDGQQQRIKHVVVIVQENRSFENFFAGYPGANAPTSGCAKSRKPAPQSRPERSGSCPSGDTSVPLHQVTFKNNHDLPHNWPASMKDWDNGNMDGFSLFGKKPTYAYAYMDRKEIVPYWTMAQQYVLLDAMFPTEFGGSFTAHLTLIAGTDDLQLPSTAEVDFPNAAPDDCDSVPGTRSSYINADRKEFHYQGPFPCFDQFNTIAEVLDRADISWRIYATRVLAGGFWEPFEEIKYVRYGPDWPSNVVAPQTKVLTDISSGNLAAVTWVTPSYADSDHPAHHSDQGPSWVSSIVNAIGESPFWNSTAIIVLWDDWGGFYDNAKPPQLDYRGLGIRVPCLIISPYAKVGYVDHTQYEFGSILRFIEEVNGVRAGSIGSVKNGYTDGRATGLSDAFDFTKPPRKFSTIPSKYPRSYFLHEPPSSDPVDTQ
ncbi:MAG TPA: alkaline phosphatase family protein [Candidatus Cybelea sp.]|nr:alkaline phosphatase family protein [Candidatus Cybelea sp.]